MIIMAIQQDNYASSFEVEQDVRDFAERRRPRCEKLDRPHRSPGWDHQMRELRERVRGLTEGERLFAVGQEILSAGANELTSVQIRGLAGVGHGVASYKRALALVAPWLFPGLGDARGRHLFSVFASRADEWDVEMRELGQRGLEEGEFVVMREVRAHLFQRPRAGAGSPLSVADLPLRGGRGGPPLFLGLEVGVGAGPSRGLSGVGGAVGRGDDWLRPRLPDPWQFEIGCHLIGVVLSARQTSVSQVARETDISRQTVARHIAAVWALVLERFPGLGAIPRRGRRKKVAEVAPDSDDLDSDDCLL
jgi:hypothetical protein